jgi:hypothetical protein
MPYLQYQILHYQYIINHIKILILPDKCGYRRSFEYRYNEKEAHHTWRASLADQYNYLITTY